MLPTSVSLSSSSSDSHVCLGLVLTVEYLALLVLWLLSHLLHKLWPPFQAPEHVIVFLTNQINWTLRSSVLGPRPGLQPSSQYTGRGFRIHLLTKDSTTVGGSVHPFRLLVLDLCRLTFYVTCLVLLPASPSVMHSCHLSGFTWTNTTHWFYF